MNNSITPVSFLANQFAKLIANVAFEIPFEPEWKNGTGYFDHAVDCYVPEGRVVKSTCPTTNRRLVLVGTVLGTVVVFERYTPDIGQPFILTWHAPKALRNFLGEPALTAERLDMIVCHYHTQTNISVYVDRLVDAGVNARLARRVNAVSEAMSPVVEEAVAPKATVLTNFEELVVAAKSVNGLVLDDHSAPNGRLQLCGLATLDKDGSSIPIALIEDDYFSVNEVYLDSQGCARISTRAVGGVVHTPKSQNVTLEEGIAAYNDHARKATWSCGEINNVTLF